MESVLTAGSPAASGQEKSDGIVKLPADQPWPATADPARANDGSNIVNATAATSPRHGAADR
jgi:hypothetical protein